MNYGVTEKLRKELDSINYEATGLLNDAEAYYENGDYDRAKETLNTLFEERPSSEEAVEGKKLYTLMETAEEERDKQWEAASEGLREEWAIAMAAQLREEHAKKGEQLEENMDELLNKEWEDVKDRIRQEWEM
jgi:hypothetical protein